MTGDGVTNPARGANLAEQVEKGFERLHERISAIEDRHLAQNEKVVTTLANMRTEVTVLIAEVKGLKTDMEAMPAVVQSTIRHDEQLRGHDRELKDIKERHSYAARTVVAAIITSLGAMAAALWSMVSGR